MPEIFFPRVVTYLTCAVFECSKPLLLIRYLFDSFRFWNEVRTNL